MAVLKGHTSAVRPRAGAVDGASAVDGGGPSRVPVRLGQRAVVICKIRLKEAFHYPVQSQD